MNSVFIVTDGNVIKAFAEEKSASKYVDEVRYRFDHHPLSWDEWDELLLDDELLDMGVTFNGLFDNKGEILAVLSKNHPEYSREDIEKHLDIMEDPDINELKILEVPVE